MQGLHAIKNLFLAHITHAVWLGGLSVPHIFLKTQSEGGWDILKLSTWNLHKHDGEKDNQAGGSCKLLEYPFLGLLGGLVTWPLLTARGLENVVDLMDIWYADGISVTTYSQIFHRTLSDYTFVFLRVFIGCFQRFPSLRLASCPLCS